VGAQFAYVSEDQVRVLGWTSGPPVLSRTVIDPHVSVSAFSFTGDGRILVADQARGVVVSCDVGAGTVLGAQQLAGVNAVAVVREGDDKGFALASTGDGVALLFSDGRLLRRDVVDAVITAIAVDPVCGDVLAATDFGPLLIAAGTLTISPAAGPA